jgi:hypothetical protein
VKWLLLLLLLLRLWLVLFAPQHAIQQRPLLFRLLSTR